MSHCDVHDPFDRSNKTHKAANVSRRKERSLVYLVQVVSTTVARVLFRRTARRTYE